ncbi:MAG: ribonuclease H-like domain-containing protein [Planctomycetota bacterium]
MYIVFDTECFKNRIIVLCAYFVERKFQKVYFENNIYEFAKLASNTNKFIGFNILDFDYKMLGQYFNVSRFIPSSLDILKVVKKEAGRGYSLDKLSYATLGLRKNGDGYQAIKWFKKGDIGKIIDYCKNDVYLTYKLYEFGRRNCFLYAPTKDGNNKKIVVDWSNF